MTEDQKISEQDLARLELIRANIEKLYERLVSDLKPTEKDILDIAPQVWDGVKPFLPSWSRLRTLDINADTEPDIVGDICDLHGLVRDEEFDVILCTEVLEHVDDPFSAVQELYRVLKPGGKLYLTTPFDFRIHGPLPDNWRFTEHGLRVLTRQFNEVEVLAVENPNRFLMPIHYALIAVK